MLEMLDKTVMKYCLGIDIQTRRDCCYAVINETEKFVKSGRFSNPNSEAVSLVRELQFSSEVYVGINAQRRPS